MITYSTSDEIDKLPIHTDMSTPTEYARIAPLITETSKIVNPLKKYIIMFALFVILSLSFIDSFILSLVPSLNSFRYIIPLIKGLIFVVVFYIIDNILKR